ncbi:Uu.00g093620.m01.CDS01 [Anthostomella pinea]|uniref:Uu.00g093620.m01.CDS01 n=1 Tax=Anthostomella pinea TaxID=933095 RepID=A0AAI8YKG5_9PEZI|nr:Uu.00g093620.m01.CDS01 [Anthostomella pinea]
MAGRRRRAASTSTVATVDDDAIQYYKENTVIKPAKNSTHTDDWPCFLLADATVYHRDGTLANLLHVDLEGPFIIRGRVEIERDQERFLVNRQSKTKSAWIQIQSTVSFSIGLKDDGLSVPVLWASGEAGWYEIIPSDRYMAVCDTMFQGISLHYAILDQYDEALVKLYKKKKNRRKTIHNVSLPLDEVLFKYALTVGDGITLPEAHQRLQDQAIFLLSHFPKDTEFHNYLRGKFPDLRQRLTEKESNESKQNKATGPSPLEASIYPTREKSSSLDIANGKKKEKLPVRSLATRSTRSSETIEVAIIEPKDNQRTLAPKPVRATRNSPLVADEKADIIMIDAPEAKPQSVMMTHAQRPTAASSSITEVKSSGDVLVEALQDSRRNVLEVLKEGKQRKHPDDMTVKSWQTKIYQECNIKPYEALHEVCLYHARDFVRLLGPDWHNTQFYKWAKANVDTPPKLTLVTEDAVKRIARRVRKPRPGARIEQGAKENTQPEAAERQGNQPHRGRPSGKAAGLRPSLGSKKRLRTETGFDDDMDVDEDGVPMRTSKKSRLLADGEMDEVHDGTPSGDDEQPESKDAPATKLVIRAEKLPSSTPQGPNQTWTCEEPDCGFVVRAADAEEGQNLITAHFDQHEKEARDVAEEAALSRVNLALQESRSGHMPINHLLDKIRSLGERTERRDEAHLNGQPLPQPIKRTLLV